MNQDEQDQMFDENQSLKQQEQQKQQHKTLENQRGTQLQHHHVRPTKRPTAITNARNPDRGSIEPNQQQHQQQQSAVSSSSVVRSILKKDPKYTGPLSSKQQTTSTIISSILKTNHPNHEQKQFTSIVEVTNPLPKSSSSKKDGTKSNSNKKIEIIMQDDVTNEETTTQPTKQEQQQKATPIIRNTVIEKPRRSSRIIKKKNNSKPNPTFSDQKVLNTTQETEGNPSLSIEGYVPLTTSVMNTTSILENNIVESSRGNQNQFDQSETNNETVQNNKSEFTSQSDDFKSDKAPLKSTTEKTSNGDTFDNHKEEEDTTSPLIFNSLADMMEIVGTLPDQSSTKDDETPSVIETQLNFSYMSPDEYKEVHNERLEKQKEIFLGRHDIFSKRNNTNNRNNNTTDDNDIDFDNDSDDKEEKPIPDDEDDSSSHDESDDGLWGVLGLSGKDDEENDEEEDEDEGSTPQPRMFITIWNAISQWVTPEAVSYVKYLHDQYDRKVQKKLMRQQKEQAEGTVVASISLFDDDEDVDDDENPTEWVPSESSLNNNNNDIGISRCNGLMAILKQHTKRCLLNEFHVDTIHIRDCEVKLSILVRCFNYNQPCPIQFDTITAQLVTCILLDTVLLFTKAKSFELSSTALLTNNASLLNITANATTSILQVVPDTCTKSGMLPEEYRYLTQSAILNFR